MLCLEKNCFEMKNIFSAKQNPLENKAITVPSPQHQERLMCSFSFSFSAARCLEQEFFVAKHFVLAKGKSFLARFFKKKIFSTI